MVPVSTLIALAGCGSTHGSTSSAGRSSRARPRVTRSPSHAGAPGVTLLLHGGRSVSLRACGGEHHYRAYAAGATVRYSGTVSPIPTGRWKVKLKIKVCTGGTFTDAGKIEAMRDEHTGAFTGSFQAPGAGAYEARALLYLNGSENAKSRKRHFLTR